MEMETQIPQQTFIDKAMAAIADPYRMRILLKLQSCGQICCGDVQTLTGLSQPTCSHHIKLLAESELIECRKEGRNNYLAINKENFKKVSSFFEGFAV